MRHQPQFPRVVPHSRAGSHALLTRAPLPPKGALDLHVLGLPPAFVLSQDQTLRLILPARPALANPAEALIWARFCTCNASE